MEAVILEEEIDLRPYIEALIQHWKFIVGLAVLAAVIAFAIVSFRPPTYEATALVAVTVPQQLVLESLTQDDLAPSFTAVNKSTTYTKAFPELAVSGELLQKLLQELDQTQLATGNVEQLQKRLEAEVGSDPTIIRLTATAESPEQAATIANTWANLFVPWANDVFGDGGDERVLFFETQLGDAQTRLTEAEQTLSQFQAENRTNIISNTLASYNQTQADLLAEQRDLRVLLQDVHSLQAQLQAQPGNETASLAHQLTALNLQLRAFNADTENALQLQIAPETELTGPDGEALADFLASLAAALENRTAQIEIDLADLEPQILALQQQLQEAETEYGRLSRARNEAEETYIALSRKMTEERISAQDTTGGVRLAGLAIVPSEPAGRGRLLAAAVAGILGGLIGAVIVLFRQWYFDWKQDIS